LDKVIQHNFTGQKCCVCGKEATKLCDAVIGKSHYAGHPPRINGVVDWSIPMAEQITCDKPLCDRHAIAITDCMDLCPEHAKKIDH
jgi:hypothetical protein